MYKIPTAILMHPSVLECEDGHANGSDKRHDVILKEGWTFTEGNQAGCRCGLFNSVADFKYAKPQRESVLDNHPYLEGKRTLGYVKYKE